MLVTALCVLLLCISVSICCCLEPFTDMEEDVLVREIPGFLTDEECDAIMDAARPNLIKSTVQERNGHGEQHSHDRVSDTAWLNIEHPAVRNLAQKSHALTGLPFSHFESVQVVRYQAQGKYDPHYDSCDVTDGVCQETNPRRWTILIYLNDDYECGGTRFPRLSHITQPQKGKALMFQVSDREGRIIHDALHGGDPVCKGEKWIATQWVRFKPFVS